MDYKISQYSYARARELGVTIFPASDRKHKLEVYDKRGLFICRVGDIHYMDYPGYIRTRGKKYADMRRAMYKIRHAKDRKVRGSPGFYADKLLW